MLASVLVEWPKDERLQAAALFSTAQVADADVAQRRIVAEADYGSFADGTWVQKRLDGEPVTEDPATGICSRAEWAAEFPVPQLFETPAAQSRFDKWYGFMLMSEAASRGAELSDERFGPERRLESAANMRQIDHSAALAEVHGQEVLSRPSLEQRIADGNAGTGGPIGSGPLDAAYWKERSSPADVSRILQGRGGGPRPTGRPRRNKAADDAFEQQRLDALAQLKSAERGRK